MILAFVAHAAGSGFRARKKASKDLEEYFLAGRSLKGWRAGISMAATQFAADTPLLVMGLIATAGIFSLWRIWIYALAFLMMGYLLGPCWRRAGVLTDAELTEFRYGSRSAGVLRTVKAIYFGTIFNCTVLAMVLVAATRIAGPFLRWHEWFPSFVPAGANDFLSIGMILAVTVLYSTTGGLRSVVSTDVVQFGIAILASLLFGWFVVERAGGLSEVLTVIRERFATGTSNKITAEEILAFTPSRAKEAGGFVLMAIGLQWLVQMNADGTGYLAQRTMACRSDADARQAAVVFTVAQVLVRSLLWLPLGLGLLVVFPPDPSLSAAALAADRELTFVRGIAEILPVGVSGLVLAGMLAALASTVDTHLNWGASYWTNDIYKRWICEKWLKIKPTDRSLVWAARAANLLIVGIALIIVPFLTSIEMAWRISLLLGAGMGILLVLRWLWWRINAWGEIACILVSSALAPVLIIGMPHGQEALRLLIMAVVSTAVGIGVSLLTPLESRSGLKEFYLRVRPPGFWGPIARAAGKSPQEARARLRKGLVTTFAAAFSLFCLLAGVGSWLVDSPAPTWFPWQGLWWSLLLGFGLALSPVWIRTMFARGLATDDQI